MGAEPVQGEEAARSDDCGEVQYIQVRGLHGRRDWFAAAGVYGDRADYGGGWDGMAIYRDGAVTQMGDLVGSIGCLSLQLCGASAPPTKAIHRGGPHLACFRRDAGGFMTVSVGCSRRYSSRPHL